MEAGLQPREGLKVWEVAGFEELLGLGGSMAAKQAKPSGEGGCICGRGWGCWFSQGLCVLP